VDDTSGIAEGVSLFHSGLNNFFCPYCGAQSPPWICYYWSYLSLSVAPSKMQLNQMDGVLAGVS